MWPWLCSLELLLSSELGAFFSLLGLLISGRLWIRSRGKCPSAVLALEIIEPFFTYSQSNSVHILIFFFFSLNGLGMLLAAMGFTAMSKLFSNRLDFSLAC